MFNTSKYTSWYFNIINQAKSRIKFDDSIYYESHHIIPRSLGGNDSESNIVKLMAREHFICHLLLTKAVNKEFKKKMNFAFWRMCNPTNNRHRPTSRQYNMGKKLFIESTLGHKPYLTSHTEATKLKISKTVKNKISNMTADERRQRVLNSCCKPESYTPERLEKARLNMIGKKKTKTEKLLAAEERRRNRTEEEKIKCGAKNKGKTWTVIDGKRVWVEKEIKND